MVNKITIVIACILLAGLLVACVTMVDNALPYDQLPKVTVATEVTLVASPSHPTSALPFDPIPAGETVQLIGTDKDAAWLLVLHDDKMGLMPTVYSRTNIGNLNPALRIEPLTHKCATYIEAKFDLASVWKSNNEGAVVILGSIYRPQTEKAFDDTSLHLRIEGNGAVLDSDYVHTALTESSAIVLFKFSVIGLQKGSQISFELANPGVEPIFFQVAFFNDKCSEHTGDSWLYIGKMKFISLPPGIEFAIKHLTDRPGEQFTEVISYNDEARLDNSAGEAPVKIYLELKRNYRYQIIEEITDKRISEEQVKDRIAELYKLPPIDKADTLEMALCPISVVIPSGHKASLTVEWTERWAEGVISEGKEGDGNRLGTYQVFLGYIEPCSLVNQKNTQ